MDCASKAVLCLQPPQAAPGLRTYALTEGETVQQPLRKVRTLCSQQDFYPHWFQPQE